MKVFFSYAKTDRPVVEPIVAAFREAGLTAEPVESRDEASCVVVFWSKAAADSEWVQEEIRKAVKDWADNRLLLATLDDTPLPIALRDLEPFDVRGGVQELIQRLIVHHSEENRSRATATSDGADVFPWHRLVRRGLIALLFLIVSAVGFWLLIDRNPHEQSTAPPPVPARKEPANNKNLADASAPPSTVTASTIEQEIAQLKELLNSEAQTAAAAGGYTTDAQARVENARAELQQLERLKADWERSSTVSVLAQPNENLRIPIYDLALAMRLPSELLARMRWLAQLHEIERNYQFMLSNPSWVVQERLVEQERQTKLSDSPWRPPPGGSASPENVESGPQATTLVSNPEQGLVQRLHPIHYFFIMTILGAIAVGALAIWKRRRSIQPQTLIQVPASSDAPQVFVSYSSADGKAVEKLVQQIKQFGYSVWIDRQSTGAQRYAARIVPAIRMSKLVALMCSQNAFATGQVIREVYLAGDLQKPFIVFQLDPTDPPDEVLYFISGFPRIPVTVDREKLLSEIKRLIAA